MKTYTLLLFSTLLLSFSALAACPDGFKPTPHAGLCQQDGVENGAFVYLEADGVHYTTVEVSQNDDRSLVLTRPNVGDTQGEVINLPAPQATEDSGAVADSGTPAQNIAVAAVAASTDGEQSPAVTSFTPAAATSVCSDQAPNKECVAPNAMRADQSGSITTCKCSRFENGQEIIASESVVEQTGPDSFADRASNPQGGAGPNGASVSSVGGAAAIANNGGRVPAATAAVIDPANSFTDNEITEFLNTFAGLISSANVVGKDPNSVKLQSANEIYADAGSFFGGCELLLESKNGWEKIIGGTEASASKLFNPSYSDVYMSLRKDLNAISELTKENVAKVISKNAYDAIDQMKLIQKCVALSFMTDKVDYSDGETSSVEGIDSIKKSFDGKIKAQKNGVETQDYPACSNAINVYNAAFLGQKGLEIGQEFQFQEAALDSSMKAQETINTDITAGLKAQQEMVDEQKNITNVRAAFSGAKGAAMFAAYQAIPTKEDLVSSCTQQMGKGAAAAEVYNAYVAALTTAAASKLGLSHQDGDISFVGSGTSRTTDRFTHVGTTATTTAAAGAGTPIVSIPPVDSVGGPGGGSSNTTVPLYNEKACIQVANEKISLAINEKSCREKVFKAMMDAGVEAASNMLKSKLLGDQSDMIGDAINNVKKFDDDNPAPTFEEFNPEVCQIDPSAPECAGVDPLFDRGRTFSGNGISIDGFQRATSGGNIAAGDRGDAAAANSDDKGGRGAGVNGIGTTIGAPKNNTAFTDRSPGAATMKKGGGAGAGGGGGGGVGAAASAGGGGGALGGGGDGSRGAGGPNGGRVSFVGGGKGSLSFGGGGGGKGRKGAASTGGNPFSKFFKNKKAGANGKELNFRGIASVGNKKDSLFGMISSRYDKVKSDRLLKYTAEDSKK